MTHWVTLDDWDSDEDEGPSECWECCAGLDEFGRCWFCDGVWIWSEPWPSP